MIGNGHGSSKATSQCQHLDYCTSRSCPVRDEHPCDCSRLSKFLDGLVDLKRELNIHPGRGSDKDRRRIAVVVTDYFVRCDFNENINKDWLLEGELYDSADGLACDPIPEEVRLADLPPAKRWPPDPLALYPRVYDKYPASHFTNMILDCLRYPEKEKQDGKTRSNRIKLEDRATAHPSVSRRISRSHKGHARFLEKKVRPPVRKAGIEDHVPGT